MGNERIPQLSDGKDYLTWKKEVEIWKLGTTAKDKQQAPRLVGFMEGKAHKAAIQIAAAELGTTTGVTKLFAELDKIFLKDSTQSLFQAIESFEQYTRSSSETIDEYIREFEQRYKRLKDLRGNKEAYEDGIKAFKLLHQANLKPEQKRLVRATTIELTYKGMANALKRTFGDGSGILNASLVADAEVPKRSILWKPSSSTSEDEMNVLYVNGEWYERVDRQRPEENFKDRRYQRPNFYQRQRLEKTQEERRRKRPQFQQRSPKKQQKCFIRREPGHIVATCPYNEYRNDERKGQKLTFLTKTDQQAETISTDVRCSSFLAETKNKGLLDTGASSTVCGRRWLDNYVDNLPPWRAEQITTQPCSVSFRFGDGDVVRATELVKVPVQMFGQRLTIETHVVDCSIPLLISRQTMKEHRFVFDIFQKKVYAMGGEEPIHDTQSGHMAISIRRSEDLRSRTKTCVSEHKKDLGTQDKAKKRVAYASYSEDSSDSEESSREDENQNTDPAQVQTVKGDSAVTEEETAPVDTPQDSGEDVQSSPVDEDSADLDKLEVKRVLFVDTGQRPLKTDND